MYFNKNDFTLLILSNLIPLRYLSILHIPDLFFSSFFSFLSVSTNRIRCHCFILQYTYFLVNAYYRVALAITTIT